MNMSIEASIAAVGRPMADAPRDGSLVVLMHEDAGIFTMRYGHIQRNGMFPGKVGMWVLGNGAMTWQDTAEDGPSHWCPLEVWEAMSPPRWVNEPATRLEGEGE